MEILSGLYENGRIDVRNLLEWSGSDIIDKEEADC